MIAASDRHCAAGALFLGCALAALASAQPLPDTFAANRSAAELCLRDHRLKEAIPYLERARRLDPSNYDNGYDLALAYLETGDTTRSRGVINSLLRQKDRAELHNLLGDVEERDGHIQPAAREYELAARMDPTEKNLFDLASDLMLHRGFEAALKVFTFGVARYPQSAKMRVGLGTADYSLGQYDDAVENLCKGVDLDPNDTKALNFLGGMYDISAAYAGRVTERLAHFAQIYPDNPAANYYYALSLRKRALATPTPQSNAQAEQLLLRAVRLRPDYTQAHFELGLLYEDEKLDSKAIEQYQAVIRLGGPDLAKAHYHAGRLYEKAGHTALAQKEFAAFELLKKDALKKDKP